MNFQELNLPNALLRALRDKEYERPTPIQMQAIPAALEAIRPCLLLWGLLPLLFGSCSFGDEPSPCPYDVRLEYWYAGSGVEKRQIPQLKLNAEDNLAYAA